jgi:hypothetical protein
MLKGHTRYKTHNRRYLYNDIDIGKKREDYVMERNKRENAGEIFGRV